MDSPCLYPAPQGIDFALRNRHSLLNIASITPNTPHDPVFWTITFKDQFALRVTAPLPLGL